MRGKTGGQLRRFCGKTCKPACSDEIAYNPPVEYAHLPLLEGFSDGALAVLHLVGFRSAATLRCASRSWYEAIAGHFHDQLRWVGVLAVQQCELSTIDDGQGITEVKCTLHEDQLRVMICPIDPCEITQAAVGIVDSCTGTVGPAWAVGPVRGDTDESWNNSCTAYCAHCVVDFKSATEVHVMPLANPSTHHVVDISSSKYSFPDCELRMQHCASSNNELLVLHVLSCGQNLQESNQQTFVMIDLTSGRHQFVTASNCPKIICRLTLTDNFLVISQGEITDSHNNAVNKDYMYLGDWQEPGNGCELALYGDEWPSVEDESRGGTRWLAAWKLPAKPWAHAESSLDFVDIWHGIHGNALEPVKDIVAVASNNFELFCVDLSKGEHKFTTLDSIEECKMGRAALARGAVAAPIVASSHAHSAAFSGFALWEPTSGALLRHVAIDQLSRGLNLHCAVHSRAPPYWADSPMQSVGSRCADGTPACCVELETDCQGRIAAHPSRSLLALSLGSNRSCRWTLLLHFGCYSEASDKSNKD